MTEQSTVHYQRTSPQVARITFANPPVNLIVGETVLRLIEIVDELATDADIQVVVFDSGVPPDFFYNHFDLAAAADFPAPRRRWSSSGVDRPGPEAFQGPYITIATIRGAAPAAGGATSSHSRSTCATPAARKRSSGSPRSAVVCCPVVGGHGAASADHRS